MGIGLAVAREIVQAHGGRLVAQNVARRRLREPAAAASQCKTRRALMNEATVLIVEDEAALAAGIAELAAPIGLPCRDRSPPSPAGRGSSATAGPRSLCSTSACRTAAGSTCSRRSASSTTSCRC